MRIPSVPSSPRAALTRAAFRSLLALGLGAGAVASGWPGSALADDIQWIGGSGNFNNVNGSTTAGGWSTANVPGTRDNGINDVNGTTIIIDSTSTNTGTAGSVSMDDVRAATDIDNVSATWQQEAGTTVTLTGEGWFRLGGGNNSTGTYNLNGGTLQNNDGNLWNIGENAGTGVLNMNGGTLQNTTGNAGRISVGGNDGGSRNTTGTLTMTNGAVIESNAQLWLGEGDASNKGTLNLNDGTVTMHNWIGIGRESGNGTLNMTGGTISKDSAATVSNNNEITHITLAGLGSTQTGAINMTGGTINIQSGGGTIWIGETANGVMTVSGGTVNATENISLGQAGGSGTLTLQGANSGPTGTLANGGGTEVVVAPNVYLGSTDPNNNFISATVNLLGGTLSTNGFIAGSANVGQNAGTRLITFGGGTLQATADNTSFLAGVTSQAVAGGAVIDTNGHSVTIDSPISSGLSGSNVDGGLTKNGMGILTLTQSNSYTGPTTVNAGTLRVTRYIGAGNTAGPVTVAQGATLAANAAFNLGASAVLINGILAPGTDETLGNIGTITVATSGTMTLANTSTLAFDLTSTTVKDLIQANGARLVLQGGTLALNLGAGFDYSQSYTLFSNLTSESGSFATVTGVRAGTQAVFTFQNNSYNLSFRAIPEPSTWTLGVFGLGGLALVARQRRIARTSAS